MNLKAAKGFTIIELLIVIVVIAILAAISIVAYTGIQDNARGAERVSNAKSVFDATNAYATQEGELPADAATLVTALTGFSTVTVEADVLNLITETAPTAAATGDARKAIGYSVTGGTATITYLNQKGAVDTYTVRVNS